MSHFGSHGICATVVLKSGVQSEATHIVEATSKVYMPLMTNSTRPRMLVLLVGILPLSHPVPQPVAYLSDLTEDLKRPLFNRRQLISYQNIMSESLPSGPDNPRKTQWNR